MNRYDNRTAGVPAFEDVKVIFSSEDDAFKFLNDRGVFQHNVGHPPLGYAMYGSSQIEYTDIQIVSRYRKIIYSSKLY